MLSDWFSSARQTSRKCGRYILNGCSKLKYRYVVSQLCKNVENNSHNRVLGVIFEDVDDRAKKEQELIRSSDKCDECQFHSSIVNDDCLKILPYINEFPDNKWFNKDLTKYLAIIIVLVVVILSVSLGRLSMDLFKDDAYLKYLAMAGVLLVALSSFDSASSSRFSIVANFIVVGVAVITFWFSLVN